MSYKSCMHNRPTSIQFTALVVSQSTDRLRMYLLCHVFSRFQLGVRRPGAERHISLEASEDPQPSGAASMIAAGVCRCKSVQMPRVPVICDISLQRGNTALLGSAPVAFTTGPLPSTHLPVPRPKPIRGEACWCIYII
jgi:hypothetical protein